MKFDSVNKKYLQLNDHILGEMKRQKISQGTMANWLNLTQGCISQKLCGKVEWTAREVISVHELLGIKDEWST